MNMKPFLSISLIALLGLAGCGRPTYHNHQYKITHHKVEKREYRRHSTDTDFPWIYYYILFAPDINTYYYYTSRTPVVNISNISLTKSVGSLPKELEEDLEQAEQVGQEQDLTPTDEPTEVVQDTTETQMSDMNSEGGVSPSEGSSDTGATSTDSAPADSGGGSDGGGGGGDGGD